eukprot:gene7467-13238_t
MDFRALKQSENFGTSSLTLLRGIKDKWENRKWKADHHPSKSIAKNHRALSWDSCELRCHIKCGDVSPAQHTQLQLTTKISWNCQACIRRLNLNALPIINGPKTPPDHDRLTPEETVEPQQNTVDLIQATFRRYDGNIKIAHINMQSLLPSKHMVEHLLDQSLIDVLVPQESPNKELIERISSYHLSQEISEATRVTAETQTLIDLIIKTPTLNTIKSGVYHPSISDHSLLYCIPITKKVSQAKHPLQNGEILQELVSEKFRADVSQLPLKDCLKTNDTNEEVSKWNGLYTNTLNKHASLRKIKIRSKPKPWFTHELQTLLNNRDNTRIKTIVTKSEIVWKQYQVEKKSVIKAVRDARDSFFQKTLTECKETLNRCGTALSDLLQKKSKVTLFHLSG